MADGTGRCWVGMGSYVWEEIRLGTAGLAEPHKLIHAREGDAECYYVTVASVAGLDAALADSGIAVGCLVVQVLPTATLSDCRVTKEAAEAGVYRGLDFLLLATPEDDDPVDARIVSSLEVIEARYGLEDATSNLAALTRARPESRPGAATRAVFGAEQWENLVNRARTDVLQSLVLNAERLRPVPARFLT